jgi:predicted PurR-regulated permease PerM
MTEPVVARPTFRPLLILVAIVLGLGFLVFHHFLLVFAVAGPIAMFLAPVHRSLTRGLRGRSGLAAALIVAFCAALVLVPILGSATLLSQQAIAFFDWARPRLEPAALQALWTETLPQRYPWLKRWFDFDQQELARGASAALSRGVAEVNQIVQVTVARLTSAVFDLAVFVLMLFFFLRDGSQFRERVAEISPLSPEQESQIFDHLTRTVKGVLRAMIVVPIVQGLIAFPAFYLLGVPAPLLWSVMVFLAALIPLLGSPLAWVPAVVYLFVAGQTWQWVSLLLYGLVVISGIDNLVKPVLLRDAARIHPLLGFLAIVGGFLSFGPLGFFVGPVVLSLVISALRIYRLEMMRVALTRSQPAVAPAATP